MTLNSKKKYYCRYKSNLKGKGLKIGLMEYSTTKWLKDNYFHYHPLFLPIWGTSTVQGRHPEMSYKLLKDMLPEAEIYILPHSNNGFEWAIENSINIISMSVSNAIAEDTVEKLASKSILLVTSGGNRGNDEDHYESESCRNEWWIGTAPCNYWGKEPEIASYSSYGLGKIFNCGMTYLQFDDSNERYSGSSASAPWNVGLYGQFYEEYKNQFGVYPNPKFAVGYIKNNSYDLGEKGKDLHYGHGIFKLPKEWDFSDYVHEIDYIKKGDEISLLLEQVCRALNYNLSEVLLQNSMYKLLLTENGSEVSYELFENQDIYTTYESGKFLRWEELYLDKVGNEWYVNSEFISELMDFSYRLKDDKVEIY